MRDILLVVDMQNDFVSGALGTKEALEIVPRVVEKINSFNGDIYFTRDTHEENYLDTQEGKKLPVKHCVRNTYGWEIIEEIRNKKCLETIDKNTFGSSELALILKKTNEEKSINSITLIGLCTDICVISNALLIKAFLPEVSLIVDSKCCAGVTPTSHNTALEAMKTCQITVI